MTATREETARAFAEAMGWKFYGSTPPHTTPTGLKFPLIPAGFTVPTASDPIGAALFLPFSDAPLHAHLAFVGRVAEALGDHIEFAIESPTYTRGDTKFRVTFWTEAREANSADAADLALAAMLAAIEAKGAG